MVWDWLRAEDVDDDAHLVGVVREVCCDCVLMYCVLNDDFLQGGMLLFYE